MQTRLMPARTGAIMYQDVPFPLGPLLAEADKTELTVYGRWFDAMLATRPAVLQACVTETDGFGRWTADYSPGSLAALDDWLLPRLQLAPASGPPPVISKPADLTALLDQTQLSDRTLSLLLDCGFYLGHVIQRSMPGTRWFLVRSGGRRFIDFGHVVLGPFDLYNFNPIRLMTSKGYAHFANPEKEMTLTQMHDHWRQKAVLIGDRQGGGFVGVGFDPGRPSV